MRNRPVPKRWLAAGTCALALVSGAGIVGVAHASSSTASAAAKKAQPARTTPVPTIATSGPGIDQSSGLGGVAVVQARGENLAGKTLTVVALPNLQVYAYPVVANVPDPAFPGSGKQVAEAWVISNPTQTTGQIPPYISYGAIRPPGATTGPSVHISTLAFGAIPISADLTLAQTVTAGKVDPLVVNFASATFNFTLSGQLTVQVSNVSVDGTSLNIAPTCRTVAPALLIAHATSEEYSIARGGQLSGSVTIPAFTGCTGHTGAGGAEDLDPLFDGTISGTSNPTFLTQAGLGSYNPAYAGDCHPGFGYLLGCSAAPAVPSITASIPVPTVNSSQYDPPVYP